MRIKVYINCDKICGMTLCSSVLSPHTHNGVVILNAELCNPSLCVFGFLLLSVVFFLCPSAVFVQTLVCYADFFVLCIVWWVLIKSSSLFSGELSALF